MPRSAIVMLVLLSLCRAVPVFAQQPPQRFEVAVQASMLRFSDFRFDTPVGIGGRFSYDVRTWLTFEGEVDYFASDKVAFPEGMTSIGSVRQLYSRQRTDAVVGVKVGVRGERLGTFIKARPGVTRLHHESFTCLGPGC